MNIKNLASGIITKLILSLILASAIVISIVHFLQLFHEYLAQFQNGSTIETVTYAVILIGSGLGIYFLLADETEKKVETSSSSTSSTSSTFAHDFSLSTLGLQFLEGFLSGMNKRKDVQPPSNY